jgi:hypothetical protein
MPLSVVHDERDTRLVRHLLISCDECGRRVTDAQIKRGGGLLEMGWRRQFNTSTRRNEYFCPKHK